MTDGRAVRVGIVSWNVAEHLARCLAALPAALDGLAADVVVVDNASSDASVDVAERAGAGVVRAEGNLGYARAMNVALADASAPFLIALNPDTVPAPGSLRRLVEELEREPRAAVVGPLLRRPSGAVEHSAHRFPSVLQLAVANLVPATLQPRWLRDRLWLHDAVRPGRTADVDWVVGAVHVLRRSALPPGGVYRERWFMYAEDVDLCWRLARDGWRTRFVGEVEVVHVGGASARQVATDPGPRWTTATYDWYALAFGGRRTRVFAALNLAGELLRGNRSLARRHLRVAVRGVDPARH